MKITHHLLDLIVLLSLASAPFAAHGQQPRIFKIDPPNWWAQMPKPLLLVRGENLNGAIVKFSDPVLKLESKKNSSNGHWMELWLNGAPTLPETITITIKTNMGSTAAPYQFKKRRPASDGFAGFSSQDVLYLIMTDRFADGDLSNDGGPEEHAAQVAKPRGWHGGDLRGIEQHIDYLQDLGITTVWITPVYQNHQPDSYHGYGATDMFAVDEHYGKIKDLQSLASALHARHMKLVLDLVPNHVGPAHPWVDDSPEPTWFHGTRDHHRIAQGDFKPLTDPHASWRDQRDVTEGWFANLLPDLNQENPAVAQYLMQNAIWWIEQAGLDGLRLDTFPYVARLYWHSFHAKLHALYPHLTTVGEVFNPDPTITSSFAGGVIRNGADTGLGTPFDFPTYFALREVFLQDAPMTKLANVLRMDALYPHSERLVPFLGNHDTTRFLNDPAATPGKLDLAFTLLATMRGMPQFYSGDEIAMRGGEDPDNRRDFPGGFLSTPGQMQGAAEANAFRPDGRTPEQQRTFHSLQTLLALRRSHPALQRGAEQLLHVDDDVMIYVRTLALPMGSSASGRAKTDNILVAINKGKLVQTLTLHFDGTSLEGTRGATVLRGASDSVTMAMQAITIRVAAEKALIVELDQ